MAKKNFNESRQAEIIGLLLITISLLIGISFVTYSPLDELAIDRYFLIENAMGILGVFISYFLIKFGFGYFSWGLVVLIALWGWWIFAKKDNRMLIRFSIYFLSMIFILAAFFSIPGIQVRLSLPTGYLIGGLLGGTIADLLQDWIGKLPTVLVLSILFIILVFSYLRWSLYQPVGLFIDLVRAFFRKTKENISNKWITIFENRAIRKENKQKIVDPKIISPVVETKDTELLQFSDDELPDIPNKEPAADEFLQSQTEISFDTVKENDIDSQFDSFGENDIPDSEKLSEDIEQTVFEESTGDEDEVSDFEVSEKLQDEEINYDEITQKVPKRDYKLPSVELLNEPEEVYEVDEEELNDNAKLLTQTLADFGVSGKVVRVVPGPVVTLYEVEPATGVRVNRISVLADDIARVMAAKRIRIIAPIPGKKVVGVEIPNRNPEIVYLRSIVNSDYFFKDDSVLSIALGKTVNGKPFTFNLAKMPHILIAGTTGSGKSVCINTLIMSILYRAKPNQVKFILVDPKKLELSIYKALVNYHLITSEDIDEYVITTPHNAVLALRSAEVEMERRYTILSEAKVRNIDEYNQKAESTGEHKTLPYIVVIIDELADLMITASREIEEPVARLAQMARAVGIHLVVATQRPSVDVITGVIRSNFPARIGFQVPTKIDSRTILDTGGAEKLLGKGDMLFLSPGTSEPIRVHNSFVVLEEIENVLDHISQQPSESQEFVLPSAIQQEEADDDNMIPNGNRDKLFDEALKLIVQHQQGSISLVQRRLRVGYSRAARLIDELEQAGIVGPFTGSKAREVLVGPDYLERMQSFEDGSFDED